MFTIDERLDMLRAVTRGFSKLKVEVFENQFLVNYAQSIDANAVHGSDSAAAAAREIAYFFAATEICAR